jgi:WD40 repeat protein
LGMVQRINACDCSHDGTLVAVAISGVDSVVRVIDAVTGRVHLSLPHPSARVMALRFHPSDDTLVATCRNNKFTLYDGRSGMIRDWSKEYESR